MTVIMRRCDHCKLMFHKGTADEGIDGCQCLKHDCGCRLKREKQADDLRRLTA